MTLTLTQQRSDEASAEFPGKLRPLFSKARYKVIYGGRGAGKSHSVATYLLSRAMARPQRILCCREFQSSIRESVHRLLSDKIVDYRLSDRFEVLDKSIRGLNGSEIIFEGLRHNVSRIRSLEGIDLAWCEEAQVISNSSWNVLIPTIRKPDSEIIITLNPELETDATFQRFVLHPPTGAIVIRVNYPDNPWFPDVLKAEMEDLRQRDPDAYQHVWLGMCRQSLDGAIYAREIREAQEQNRITSVRYDPTKPVSVYFDLGWADNTSIWFAQHIAGEVRLIDFYQDAQRAFSHYLQVLQSRNYVYQTMWLPHDAQAKSLGTGRSIEELARAAGWRVRIVPKLSLVDGINAVRTVFPMLYFDQERCADGIQALRYYRYDVDGDTGVFSRLPLHDSASHAADGLRYACVALMEQPKAGYRQKAKAPPLLQRGSRNTGWLRH